MIARLPVHLAFALALVLTGCSRSEKPVAPDAPALENPGNPVQGDWVIERISGDTDSLNPLIGEDTNGKMISAMITEGMLQMDNFTLRLKPCLAESYEISADQFTYTFHLRKGVKWHDGEPFTAADVKFSYDRLQDPAVDAAPTRSYFTNIKSCEMLDDYTIRFTATERYFKTLEVLGTYLLILPKHVFEKDKSDFNKHRFGRNPIGTGPYKFVRWDTGERIIVERNDNYWAGPIYYPKRLIFEIIEEPYIAAQLLKKGEIDAFNQVSPIQWEHDLKNSRSMKHLHEIVYPYPAYYYLGFNLRNPLFTDIRTRHAIDLLMPRDEIISQIYLNQYASKASGYDPPDAPSYNHEVLPTPYDPKLALQLLHEAGWKDDHGDGILYRNGQRFEFTLLYPSGNPSSQKMVELIQESLRRAGIDLKLSRLEFAQLIARVNDWKFEASLQGWSLDIDGDPSQIWSSAGADEKKSSNFIGYKSAEADKLMAEAKLEYDPDKRAAIYRRLHRVIHDDYPVCFLINIKQILVISNRYQNVKTFTPRPCFDIMSWWVPLSQQKYKN